MVKVAVLDLSDPKNRNRWIIGTPDAVPKSSPFYSKQIQVAYVNNPEKDFFFERQVEHYHTTPIEEYILILHGTLKLEVEDAVVDLKPMQLLSIPPNKRHKIVDYSSPLEYFLIRAPISSENTKVVTE